MNKFSLNIAPADFVEGKDILKHTKLPPFGDVLLLIGEEFILDKFHSLLQYILKSKKVVTGIFNKECSENEINRLIKTGKKCRADFVVGIGGGKALDTAKAVAYYLSLPMVMVPTSAATCAAWTALSAIYTDDGKARKYLILDRCPELVILDTGIIGRAPVRYLNSGMADALAKYYEAMAFTQGAQSIQSPQGRASHKGIEIALRAARSIHETVFESGVIAARDSQRKKFTPVLVRIIETNIMLAGLVGGIGGEGCRASAVHALCNGFTQIPQTRQYLHGEIVAFCNLVQLVLEKKFKEVRKLINLYKKLRLPCSLKDIGVSGSSLPKVIRYACSKKETMGNFPIKVTERMVYDAVMKL